MWVSKAYVEKLKEDISYWREAFERERDRADRMQDNFMQMNGATPASIPGIQQMQNVQKENKDTQEQLKELFVESVGDFKFSAEEKDALENMGIMPTGETN